MKALCIGLAGVMMLSGTVWGAEMGRQVVGGAERKADVPRGGGVPVTKNYTSLGAGESGLELSIDWVSAEWSVGSHDYSESTWAPSVALSYGATDYVDIRADFRAMSLEADAKKDAPDPSLDIWRIGVGVRGWLNLSGDLYGYAGGLLGYYGFSGDALDSIEGTVGGALDAGIAYLLNERTYVRAGLQYEQTLSDASGKLKDGGESEDLSVSAIGFGVGAGIRF